MTLYNRIALTSILLGCFVQLTSMPVKSASSNHFSLIVIPDTQNVVVLNPTTKKYEDRFNILQTQMNWIKNSIVSKEIAFVLHEGDMTNHNYDGEWSVFQNAIQPLRGKIPYALAIGNHDLLFKRDNSGYAQSRDTSTFNRYFPVASLTAETNLAGTFDGKMENSYYLFEAVGIKWMILNLEFGPRQAVVDWANQIAANHPFHRIIVLTHGYMNSDGTRLGVTSYDPLVFDSYNPHYQYKITDAHDGDELWNEFVKKHRNISFVFSGHIYNQGTSRRRVDTGVKGNAVYQFLADYQNMENGGNGYLRIMDFYKDSNRFSVSTYSPHLNQFMSNSEDKFEYTNTDVFNSLYVEPGKQG